MNKICQTLCEVGTHPKFLVHPMKKNSSALIKISLEPHGFFLINPIVFFLVYPMEIF